MDAQLMAPVTLDANGFPVGPEVDELPVFADDKERYQFVFRVMAEQGERLGDYLFAACCKAGSHELRGRWVRMLDVFKDVHGSPITLTYHACERLAAEAAALRA